MQTSKEAVVKPEREPKEVQGGQANVEGGQARVEGGQAHEGDPVDRARLEAVQRRTVD